MSNNISGAIKSEPMKTALPVKEKAPEVKANMAKDAQLGFSGANAEGSTPPAAGKLPITA